MDIIKRASPWNEANVKFLKENYKTLSYGEIAISLNLSKGQVLTKRTVLKLVRLPTEQAAINTRTNSGMFTEGKVPWNSGTKGVMKANATSFKPGNKAKNVEDKEWYDGAIVVVKDIKTNRCHKKIRIRAGHWIYLNRHNWEQNYGAIPKGNIIIFKDGDSMNCEAWNLECITRADKLEREKTNIRAKWAKRKQQKELFNRPSGLKSKIVKKVVLNPFNTNGNIAFKLNEKTTVFAKPGTSIEVLKQKYGIK
jgi:hypothetical protein